MANRSGCSTRVLLLVTGIFLCLVPALALDSLRMEAEDARTIFLGDVDWEHAGYSGRGYVDLKNQEGSFVQWSFCLPGQEGCTLRIRYANGSGSARFMALYINGRVLAEELPFTAGGEWSVYRDLYLPLSELPSGSIELCLLSMGEEGGPNLDFIEIGGLDIPEVCPPCAADDHYRLDAARPFAFNPLENDVDFNGDSLFLLELGNPQHGEISGSLPLLWYTPGKDFLGTDSCSYIVSDGSSGDTATIRFLVRDADWSEEVAGYVMSQGSGADFADWHYKAALFLEGLYRVYRRTGNPDYLAFIREWADARIDEQGNFSKNIDRLDHMLPGIVFLRLWEESGEEKYRKAALKICGVLEDYPRTADHGLWHMEKTGGQLWLDGLYMSMPLLARVEQLPGSDGTFYEEIVHQFRTYFTHLYDLQSSLLFHAYDEDGSSEWAEEPHRHSPEFWGRSIGWYCMGLVEVLELMPAEVEGHSDLVNILATVLSGLSRFQDRETGLWYQVVNRGEDPDNWLETSCSMMYTYSMKRYMDLSYGSRDYAAHIDLAYQGVLGRCSLDEQNGFILRDICEGTGVGDYAHYLQRRRISNDLHGLGAFLIMNELVAYDNMAVMGQGISGMQNQPGPEHISVYPNPASDRIFFHTPRANSQDYLVCDLSGRIVLQGDAGGGSRTGIPVSDLAPGLYILQLAGPGSLAKTIFVKH